MNTDILLGKTNEHLVLFEDTHFLVHKNIHKDLSRLKKDALEDGFDLQIASAFRDHERQRKIWNLKASGEVLLLDDQEQPLPFQSLSPSQIMFAILRWSAIPGCSRHHWGTDIDVYDGNTQSAKEVKLVPSETLNTGPSARLHEWLDSKIATNSSYGFYRPYGTDRGGVSPERWHLSYYAFARRYMEKFTISLFKKNIHESDILLKDVLLENVDEIYRRFFLNVDLP